MVRVVDQWLAGSAYEGFMGQWSRQLAPKLVTWLGMPPKVHWLDVGCGTGALTTAICDTANPASVVACDPAAPLVDFAREHFRDDRVSFLVAGSGSLPSHPDGYHSVTSLLVLNFLPNPVAALQEMRGLANFGSTISACVWDYSEGMKFLRYFWDVAVAQDPSAEALDEANRFPICHPVTLTKLFQETGLVDVKCESIEIPTNFSTFDDYWQPFLAGTGPAPSYVATLDERRRHALAKRLAEKLPQGSDGTIRLSARAWAIRGRTQ